MWKSKENILNAFDVKQMSKSDKDLGALLKWFKQQRSLNVPLPSYLDMKILFAPTVE